MAASKPTSLLFKDGDAFRMTLNRHLWALTQVWVVSLLDAKLTPAPLLWPSKKIADLEFDKKAGSFQPVLPNQYLYPAINLQPG